MPLKKQKKIRKTNIFLPLTNPGSCTVPKLARDFIHECNPPYDVLHEDTRMYSQGWKGGTQMEETRTIKRSASGQLSPWVYLDPTESNSSMTYHGRIAFYPSGGYVAELGNTIEDTVAFAAHLKSYRWVDRYTRAVFIEGAVYNPNTNLIGVLEAVLEVTSANALLPRVNLKIFRLFADLNPSYAFYSACEFLFFGVILYTLYTIIKGTYTRKKDYFRDVDSWLDMVFFVVGIAIVVVYIIRESLLRHAISALKNDQGSFLNFSECGLYSEALVFLYAFSAFIAILKFINFLSFTRCVQLLSTTIYRSVVELQSFGVMLFTIFMAYASLAFTIYGPYLEDYRSVSSTLASLNSLVMGVFDFTDFTSQTDYKVVGYFFFVSFSSSMMFIFTNIVITIINVVHKAVSDDEEIKENEGSFFNIILERVLILTGFRGPPKREEPIIEEPSISELQWNLNVQYLLDNQLKRLNGLVNSIYVHGVTEDIQFACQLSRKPQECKPAQLITDHSIHGNAADETVECDHELRDNASISSNQLLPTNNTHPQQKAKSATEQQNNSIHTITQLIDKKTEELRQLQEKGDCDERERLLRVKVIKCLKDLLDKETESHRDSEKMFINREEESDV